MIDAGRLDWSDVEPDSDRETTVTASPRVELPPPPIYNQPDQLILIEENQPTPSESAAEMESMELLSPMAPPSSRCHGHCRRWQTQRFDS